MTLLLPHSHEGQGPDHTSGRLERYLQLCAEDNMRVAVPTTPASYFHLLRRQALSPKKKPLVVFTPEVAAAAQAGASRRSADFTTGTFQPVLADPGINGTARPAERQAGAALLRQGLLRPAAGPHRARHHRHGDHPAGAALPDAGRGDARPRWRSYPSAEDFAWVQEEPANQGAWSFIALNLLEHLDGVRLRRISRPAAAAPAVGSTKMHDAEQAALIEAALPRRA